ncbi:MAG: mechanosensitive ion channel [Bacteroidales bacterium]|nr:mechanosensitive ion channel [Bacteroidales bacterium]
MTAIQQDLNRFLIDKMHMNPEAALILDTILIVAGLLAVATGVNWICQGIYRISTHSNLKFIHSKWQQLLVKHNLGHRILLLIPGIAFYLLIYLFFDKEDSITHFLHRMDMIYMVIVSITIGNAMLLTFLDIYSKSDRNRSHPLKGLIQGLQVVLIFVGGIIIIALIMDKSPTALLTGLGASAAVLMLVFKDSILGFVAGVQLSQNNMIKIGDWIQMPDGSANGNVEEITLNTIKVRNWDNTLTMIPPYTLVSSPFKNWRGMQESDGRRVDKNIYLDLRSLKVCTSDMIEDISQKIPLMSGYSYAADAGMPTNSQLYRIYIEKYLRSHDKVARNLDMIISQREPGQFGLPIEVYFFITDKVWEEYEKIQSDIFDHLIAMAPEFGLKLYQLPT